MSLTETLKRVVKHRDTRNRVIALLGTFGGMVALVLTVVPPGDIPSNPTAVVLLTVATIFFAAALFLDVHDPAGLVAIPNNPDAIRDYLRKWLDRGGKAVIFSKDLTWVDEEMEGRLLARAKAHALAVCVPEIPDHIAPLLGRLEAAGAEIFTYPELLHTPKSRFTFINFDTMSAHLTIGRRSDDGSLHINYELTSRDPLYYVALDLVEVVMAVSKNRRHVQESSSDDV